MLAKRMENLFGEYSLICNSESAFSAPIVQKGARFIYFILLCMGIATGTEESLSYGETKSDDLGADVITPVMNVLAVIDCFLLTLN